MVRSAARGAGYVIPRYRAAGDVTWYHVLHGNVPGHQIDFIYCPEVPQGPLTPTHFSHAARLMKYIEPQPGRGHAFAIGNLSRDDTHHEPGHGAVALIFGLRIEGATDHAGRRNPPFAHGIVAVDRALDEAALFASAVAFHGHVTASGEGGPSPDRFYQDYLRAAAEGEARTAAVIEQYIAGYADLPRLGQRDLSWDWSADEASQLKRVVIAHCNEASFASIARGAAKLGAMLYRSNIRWTSITTGREADIAGGVSIRFAAERDITDEDARGVMVWLEELGEDEAELAALLFGANRRRAGAPRYAGWRERYERAGAPRRGDGAGGAPERPRGAPGTAVSPAMEQAFLAATSEDGEDEDDSQTEVLRAARCEEGSGGRKDSDRPGSALPVDGSARSALEMADDIEVIMGAPRGRRSRAVLWVGLGGAAVAAVVAAAVMALAPAGRPAEDSALRETAQEAATAPAKGAVTGAPAATAKDAPVQEEAERPETPAPKKAAREVPAKEKPQPPLQRAGKGRAAPRRALEQPKPVCDVFQPEMCR